LDAERRGSVMEGENTYNKLCINQQGGEEMNSKNSGDGEEISCWFWRIFTAKKRTNSCKKSPIEMQKKLAQLLCNASKLPISVCWGDKFSEKNLENKRWEQSDISTIDFNTLKKMICFGVLSAPLHRTRIRVL